MTENASLVSSSTGILAGKTAVVTGCLQGIGRAVMDAFAAHGAHVVACAQGRSEDFESHCAELSKQRGVRVVPLYFDLCDEVAVKGAVSQIQRSGASIDALVNVAGITRDALFHMMTMDQLRLTFQVNLFGQLLLTQYVTRLMLRQKRGSVVNIASITGIDGNPGQVAYSASKGALIAATKTLASELGQYGIRVNAVAPGVIATPMTAGTPADALSKLVARSRLRRIGTPAEVAEVCAYLASDRASFVTGQVVRVDGGIG